MSPRAGLRVGLMARALLLTAALIPLKTLYAQDGPNQDGPLQPGEAYVTRFSGTAPGPGGAPVIDPNGTSGGIIDVRAPRQPPAGQHWVDAPKRQLVTASQVGQVFGVVLDDARPPNVYLTATSAFGLHRAGNDWMPGMWGQDGGPGTVYRLDASTGYAPRAFARIMLNGRRNTGAALGNIAYDRTNKQLFVSDLETGMIHRIRAADGGDLGHYDHGTEGRTNFTNVADGQHMNLPAIAFDPNSSARIGNCPSRFDNSPQCWNFALTGRRVWGVGVHRDVVKNEARLYYSVWSGPAFGQSSQWNQMTDDNKRNSVWSIRLGPDGGFDTSDVRREFILPDFFVNPDDIARAGMSQPVSDIAFAECSQRPVMLISERGGIRNLGLAAQNPFASPHEARALRYELDDKGAWRAVGRYDVGFYDRGRDGAPFMHANCAGGAAFGLGYNSNWVADPGKPNQFVWISGDSLCSPEGPCNFPGTGQAAAGAAPQQAALQNGGDPSYVDGIQGMAENMFEEVAPESAFGQAAPSSEAARAAGPNQSYLIDTDINIGDEGNVNQDELARNDATKIGDVAIYQVCEPPTSYTYLVVQPPPDHPSDVSHARLSSHGRETSHYRWGSHDPYWSHNRWGSHYEYWSHNRIGSHNRERSHWRWGSHERQRSHSQWGSHDRARSHYRDGSHNREQSHRSTGSHNAEQSHRAKGSHDRDLSHRNTGSHNADQSHRASGSHNADQSHRASGSHNADQSHRQSGSHNADQSHRQSGSHNADQSHRQSGSHNAAESHRASGSHNAASSHRVTGSHNAAESHRPAGSHGAAASHRPAGSHSAAASHRPAGSHSAAASHRPAGSHSAAASHRPAGSHSSASSHRASGSHSRASSHRK
jgi:hypothetical protein